MSTQPATEGRARRAVRLARRIIVGVAWVIGGLFVWAWSVYFIVMYVVPAAVLSPHELIWNALSVVGHLLVPCLLAVLAMRGKLPGTADGSTHEHE